MKTAALTIGRNDGYKENDRVVLHLTSLLETFDEVYYIDWNSDDEKGSLLWEVQDKLPETGRLKHFVMPNSVVSQIYQGVEGISPVLTPFAHNVLLRRCDADWIACTTCDIIAPNKEIFNNFLSKASKSTFYTLSRRDIDYNEVKKHGFENWKTYRDFLDETTEERRMYAKVTPNDNYSLINCCGDFQLAHKDVWDNVDGYEEQMIFSCFTDTNIQKKAVLKGYGLEAIFDIPLYHMSHTGMGNDGSSPSKQKYNDAFDWVEDFKETQNNSTWGFSDSEIEFEII